MNRAYFALLGRGRNKDSLVATLVAVQFSKNYRYILNTEHLWFEDEFESYKRAVSNDFRVCYSTGYWKNGVTIS